MTTATIDNTKFQVGRTYSCRSACDHNCVWTYTIKSRTAATIKTTCGKTLRINKKLSAYSGVDSLYPMGQYSMAPILSADKLVS